MFLEFLKNPKHRSEEANETSVISRFKKNNNYRIVYTVTDVYTDMLVNIILIEHVFVGL